MALELNKLTYQVDDLCETLLNRSEELAASVPVAREELRIIAQHPTDLDKKIQKALNFRWAGAIPTDEQLDAIFPAPALPERADIIAADGSQVYPDRHGLALYYLINIGSIVFKHGLGKAPECFSQPAVYHETKDLYDGENLVAAALINARRDITELAELAVRATQLEKDDSAPTLTLLDNGLLLYFSLQATDRAQLDEILRLYLAELDNLRRSGAVIAGIVDRPQAASVVRLLRLATMELDEINEDTLRVTSPFERIIDRRLFEELPPEHRTAVFANASPQNTDFYKPRGHKIHFFYLNAGGNSGTILRVEIPEWVANDPEKLDLVHAGIVEQSRVTGGFPYVLMRAHELAIVSNAERNDLDQMVMQAMIQRGMSPEQSLKAQGKAWTGGSKRRYR